MIFFVRRISHSSCPRKTQKRSHSLRYTLKNRATDTVLFVVLFTLYLKEDVDEHGNVRTVLRGASRLRGRLRVWMERKRRAGRERKLRGRRNCPRRVRMMWIECVICGRDSDRLTD